MNREIEFRGKTLETGEWVYGYYGIKGESTDLVTHCIIQSTLNANGSNYFYFSDIDVIADTVGQYTGLKDKNGIEKIFEGDIMEFDAGYCGDNYYPKNIDIVEYDQGDFYAHCFLDGMWNKNGKVIGNVHDNLELLEENK